MATKPTRFYTIRALSAGAPDGVAYSREQEAVAFRALNRLGAVRDGEHLLTRSLDGLSPMYTDFRKLIKTTATSGAARYPNSTIRPHLENCRDDLFDAAATLDRIDGGITIIMRCAGSAGIVDVADVSLDTYITPLARDTGGERASRSIAEIFQKFGEELVVPHLADFVRRCGFENVIPPRPEVPAPYLQLAGPEYLPLPVGERSAFIRCRLHESGELARFIAMHTSPPPSPSDRAPRAGRKSLTDAFRSIIATSLSGVDMLNASRAKLPSLPASPFTPRHRQSEDPVIVSSTETSPSVASLPSSPATPDPITHRKSRKVKATQPTSSLHMNIVPTPGTTLQIGPETTQGRTIKFLSDKPVKGIASVVLLVLVLTALVLLLATLFY
ncbi:hypothetical protein BDN72DRAFT_905543 [Pluteus cervinus]|uniref:Uncharacterized protein n=1 Tax=Pluteus cervinus TaxID=181527 RepID=A0ACD3A284_9AGAR|nr:hypothetical protein BDN72DRAFT_905543 [Pluteus cervinus]